MIQRKLGDLESIRLRLGLSQRKMCQLLFVDPSAWTRWTKMGEEAPPHIYRMLQWYLALEDKYPALDPSFWLSAVARPVEAAEVEGLSKKVLELENRLSKNVEAALVEKDRELAKLRAEFQSTATTLQTESKKLTAQRATETSKPSAVMGFDTRVVVLILAAFTIGFILAGLVL